MGVGKKKVGKMSLPVQLEKCCVTEGWVVVVTPPSKRSAGRCVGCGIYGEKDARRREINSLAWCTVKSQNHQNGKVGHKVQ
jgi:hypothetical protein